jgi:carbamoyltransferase
LFVHGNFIFDNLPTTLYKNFLDCRTDRVTEENHIFYADYAFQVQKQTQEVVLQFVKEWVEKTGINKVCMSGGYALNVVANNYLILNLPKVEFYFEPLADDSGNSIGCALSLYKYLTKNKEEFPIADTFYHGTDPDLSTIVGETCTTEDVALALKNFKTVGVFTGKAEAGPRALGNRSILYNPQDPNAKIKVNLIKRREWYRPFAAMILEENFLEYFETIGLAKSESMTVSFDTKRPQDIPGVVHVDNSCRVQTVSNNLPHIHNLLIEFKKQTGIPVLLNTSFNLAGEALVETVDDAIKTFEETHLDILWFPSINKWIKK